MVLTPSSIVKLIGPTDDSNENIEVPEHGRRFLSEQPNGLHKQYLVTILGKTRTGKSFLLNYLHGKEHTFAVANRGSVTSGADTTAQPLSWESMASRFKVKPSSENKDWMVRLIDCEGSGNASGVYDAKLATCAAIISHTIILNIKGIVGREQLLQELGLLHEIAKELINNNDNDDDGDGHAENPDAMDTSNTPKRPILGNLIVLFRDYTNQRTEEELFSDIFSNEKGFKDGVHERNFKRDVIKSAFSNISVHVLKECADNEVIRSNQSVPFPQVKDDFKEGVGRVLQTLNTYMTEGSMSDIGHRLFTSAIPSHAGSVITALCGMVNESQAVKFADLIASANRLQCNAAMENAISKFEKGANELELPFLPNVLEEKLRALRDNALDMFDKDCSSTLMDKLVVEGTRKSLETRIAGKIDNTYSTNERMVDELLTDRVKKTALFIDKHLKQLKADVHDKNLAVDQLEAALQFLKEEALDHFFEGCYSGDKCFKEVTGKGKELPDVEKYLSVYLEPKLHNCQESLSHAVQLISFQEGQAMQEKCDEILDKCVQEFQQEADKHIPCSPEKLETLRSGFLQRAQKEFQAFCQTLKHNVESKESCLGRLQRGIDSCLTAVRTEHILKATSIQSDNYRKTVARFGDALAKADSLFRTGDRAASKVQAIGLVQTEKVKLLDEYIRSLPQSLDEREAFIDTVRSELERQELMYTTNWDAEHSHHEALKDLTAKLEVMKLDKEKSSQQMEELKQALSKQEKEIESMRQKSDETIRQLMHSTCGGMGGGFGGGFGGGDFGGGSPSRRSSGGGGRQVFTGPRGGQYYINSNGNKSYLRK